jgi:hypothetical protein
MNSVEKIMLENIDKPNSLFIFPTELAASRWADHLLRLRGGALAMKKFIAWDVFKQNSIRSKAQNKKSIPSALRKIFVSRLIRENAENIEQGKPGIFSSLIRTEWAHQAARFAPWITDILPQLGSWFFKNTGLSIETVKSSDAERAAKVFEGDDKDMFALARRYAQFLDEHNLFEPAWETPPFNDEGMECFIFFPESLNDYSEYSELLAASRHVRTISNTEIPTCDTFYYTNTRSEITEAALYIRALHEKQKTAWDSIALCIPDSENYEPYIIREFTNRNIPFVKRTSKTLGNYPAGGFFRAALECVSQDFAFSALASLVLNRNLPWEDTDQIQNLIQFGIDNNCISSWTEKKDGKEQKINVWEDAFKNPLYGINALTSNFFYDLKKRLLGMRTAVSFSEVRKNYFIFREHFFNMNECSQETDLVLSRCISELMYLCEIEKDFPDTPAVDPFLFYIEYLNEVNYLAQTKVSGVNILPYKTAAAAPFDCHIVLGSSQDNLSIIYSRLDFLTRKKREKLGIYDKDASEIFINLHKFNSLNNAAFFCSNQTFSGFTIPHSRINAPFTPQERYAPRLNDKFSTDYYNTEFNFDDSIQKKLHENQIEGFEKWKNRRKTVADNGGWHTNKKLRELINKKYTSNQKIPGKYSVSASSLASFHQCSLKWLYERVLNLENVQIEASLTAENITGILYHAVLNLFFYHLKEKKEPLLKPDFTNNAPSLPKIYRKLLEDCVEKIFSAEKIQMSALTARLMRAGKKHLLFNLENCVTHFLSYFCGCYIAGSEISYQAERDKYYLNGTLDCVLQTPAEDNEKEYIIVDFKLKRTPPLPDCTGEGENGLRDFQLPMYITLVEENKKPKVQTALFFSILELKSEVVIGSIKNEYTETTIPRREDDRISRNSEVCVQILNELNKKAQQFADEISDGNFTVFESDYRECNNCNYNRICRTVYVIGRSKING